MFNITLKELKKIHKLRNQGYTIEENPYYTALEYSKMSNEDFLKTKAKVRYSIKKDGKVVELHNIMFKGKKWPIFSCTNLTACTFLFPNYDDELLQIIDLMQKALVQMTKFSNIKVLVTDPNRHTKAHTNLANVIERSNDQRDTNEDFGYI